VAEAEARAAAAAGRADAGAAAARAAALRAAAAAAAAALPSPEALAEAAAHCNDRKAAAKAAQEASARVFLCAMLRRCRVVTSAAVLATGRSYLHAYLEELGFEARISLEAMPQRGVAVAADAATNAVTLSRRANANARNAAAGTRGHATGAAAPGPLAVASPVSDVMAAAVTAVPLM
jgi:DIS3-like exonuclease 2